MAAASARVWLAAGLGRVLLAVMNPAAAGDSLVTPRGEEIRRLRERDPAAWRELFEREMPAIYRYALSRIGDATEAEDITSAVFAEAWESAGKLEDHGLPARAWLFGVARHVVGTRRRQLFRRPPMLTLEGFDGPDGGGSQFDAEHLDLLAAIGRLKRRQAEVITLRFVHGLSLQETAAAMAASVDSVKGLQARALSELRAMLGAA
ncbi:MAG: RNA polymerase sigma factor [Hyphomicrobiales bacterium]